MAAAAEPHRVGPSRGAVTTFRDRAIAWVDDHLAAFLAPSGMRHKAVTELALASRQIRFVLPEKSRQWASIPARLAAENDLLERSRGDPANALRLLAPYLLVRDRAPISGYERALPACLARAAGSPTEALPYQRLEASFLARCGGSGDDVPGLPPDSVAATIVSPLLANESTCYQLTHGLFYATDFGAAREPELADSWPRLVPVLQALAGRFAREGHWDLVGELLTCLNAVPASFDVPLGRDLADLYVGEQLDDGSLFPDEATRTCHATGDGHDAWAHRYHPTLVAVLWATTVPGAP